MKRLTPEVLLSIVAWIFIANGALSAMVVVGSLLPGHAFRFDFDVIELWLGIGLVAHWRRELGWSGLWLILGVVLSLILLAVLAFVPLETRYSPTFPLNEIVPASEPARHTFVVAITMARLAFSWWAYRVLVRSDVRALFDGSALPGVRDG